MKPCSSRWSRSSWPWRAGSRRRGSACWCCSKAATRPARAARSTRSPTALNPRQCHVVALPKPSEGERKQWYFQRYVAHLPGAGRDRPVRPQLVQSRRRREGHGLRHRTAGRRLPEGDARSSNGCSSTTASCCSNIGCPATRRSRRSASPSALDDPLKRWKLSPIDQAAREKYADYTKAREAMLKATHTRLGAVDAGRFQRPEDAAG